MSEGGGNTDIRKRKEMVDVHVSFRRLANIVKATGTCISRETKVSILKSLVLSDLSFEYNTWKLTKTKEKRNVTFQTKCQRDCEVKWQ